MRAHQRQCAAVSPGQEEAEACPLIGDLATCRYQALAETIRACPLTVARVCAAVWPAQRKAGSQGDSDIVLLCGLAQGL